MNGSARSTLIASLVGVLVLLSACSPAAPQGDQSRGGPAPQQQPHSKILTIALLTELATWADFNAGGDAGGGCTTCRRLGHNALVTRDHNDVLQPQLAEDISVEKGTWVLNADGSMDTTWKLRPNVKWHDGTPFTAQDMLFTVTVAQDADFPTRWRSQAALIESASAPDPLTFSVHWSKLLVGADEAAPFLPLPKHLLEELYRTDKQALLNSPLTSTAWVGLGPYRLTRWEQGSSMELSRFDDYFMGRPPLDRIVLQFIPEGNTMLANILAGAVDVVLPPSVDVDTAAELRQRWQGTGNQARIEPNGRIRYGGIQHNPEYAQPRNGLPLLSVRQALHHAIDRQVLIDVATHGLAPVADSWIPPSSPYRRELEPSIPQFPYDPQRAQTLLAQAGWNRGADGTLVHSPSGERFEIQLIDTPATGSLKDTLLIADFWKALGIDAKGMAMPAALEGDREFRSKQPGMVTGRAGYVDYEVDRLHGRFISSAANRWSGRNNSGYNNPRVDVILDQLNVVIDPRQRIPLQRQLLQEQMGDIGFMPFYFDVFPVLQLKEVKGNLTAANSGWNAFEWDKE